MVNPVGIYRHTHNSCSNRYYALLGSVGAHPNPDMTQGTVATELVILQPLEHTLFKMGPEAGSLPPSSEPAYEIGGDPIYVPASKFYGSYVSGQPNFEFVGYIESDKKLIRDIERHYDSLTFEAGRKYILDRIQIRHQMIHILGYYENGLTHKVVRVIGVVTIGVDSYVIVQDITRGSLDPVIVRPVQGIDPVTEDGQRDIWNGLSSVSFNDFTSLHWYTSTECRNLYKYLGYDYDIKDGEFKNVDIRTAGD